ncbi:2604_t:CDS:2 [Acaulospora colombiana]|uniref:2604_t:CDS:1 n=1 Tax=Acaulospora colombiana TaxID=27376 RepID=A0ACA9MAS5_9GLOM|nr:2604_t:CDS:2 [Acaulospora colombiana]
MTTTKSSSKTMSERELNSRLTEIFNKIGQLDIAQQGIQELHELLMEYPECDKSPMAQKSNKPPHKFITNRCPNIPRPTSPVASMVNKESTKKPPETAKISTPITCKKVDLSELSPTTKALIDKISKETFEQTRFRLHHIFQYEKYKTGQKRASLPSLEQYQSDAERLEYAKSIIQTRSDVRRSTWPINSFFGTNEITTSAISAN